MEEKDFLVDAALIRTGGNLLNFFNQKIRIDKEKNKITLTSGKNDLVCFDIKQFVSKKLKSPEPNNGTILVPMFLDTNNKDNKTNQQLKLMVKPAYHPFLVYFIETYNKMIEANKEAMKNTKTNLKRPGGSYDLHYRDPLQSTSILNKKTCEKLERKLVLEKLEEEKRTGVKSPDLACMSQKTIDRLINTRSPRNMIEASDAFDRDPVAKKKKLSPDTENKQETPKTGKQYHLSHLDVSPKNTLAHALSTISHSSSDSALKTGSPTAVKKIGFPKAFCPSVWPEPVCLPAEESTSTLTYKSEVERQNVPFSNRKLGNTGNSCYFNATMQSLSACIPLVLKCSRISRLYYSAKENFDELNQCKVDVLKGFLKLINVLGVRSDDLAHPSSSSRIKSIPEEKLKAIRLSLGKVNRDFDNFDQQDAHEYLITILGIIDDLMEAIAKRDHIKINESPVYKLSVCPLNPAAVFQMKVETVYECQECGARNVKTETRSDVCLIINKERSVKDLLPSFVKWSALEKDCQHCKHTVASSSERIVQFPQCLIVNLKRYERVGADSYQKKSCTVRPSFELDASVLGILDPLVEHPELEKTFRSEDQKPEDEASESRDNNNNSTPVKVKGGMKFTDESLTDEDVIVDFEKEKSPFEFKTLSDEDEIEEMLRKLNIEVPKRQLDNHIKKMKGIPVTQFDKNDAPSDWKDIKPDGNCFYRAISWCLTGDQKYHSDVRAALAQFIRDNKEMILRYSTNHEEHLEQIGIDKTWARHIDIIALSTCLNVNIYTYLSDGWTQFTPREHNNHSFEKRKGSIYLTNPNEHYEPVLSLKKRSPGANTRRLRKRKQDEDNEKNDDDEREKSDEKPEEKSETPTRRDRLTRSCKTSGAGTSRKIAVSDYPDSPGTVKYSLVSVICHKGDSPEKGHYVAYTKELYSNQWLYCSDSVVHPVSKEKVDSEASDSGYVLFYTRK